MDSSFEILVAHLVFTSQHNVQHALFIKLLAIFLPQQLRHEYSMIFIHYSKKTGTTCDFLDDKETWIYTTINYIFMLLLLHYSRDSQPFLPCGTLIKTHI